MTDVVSLKSGKGGRENAGIEEGKRCRRGDTSVHDSITTSQALYYGCL